jgi:tryptophan synthase alpha chain
LRGEKAILKAFERARSEKRLAFIPYFTAGFPGKATFFEVLDYLLKEGDIVEIGVPFSDPIADGPTIQKSSFLALKEGVDLKKIFSWIKKARRKHETPIVLMSYFNPILSFGLESFFKEAKEAGVDGVIIPDLSLEESIVWFKKRSDIAVIFLAAPTSRKERLKEISKRSKGFLYCVSVTGVTGARKSLPSYLFKFLEEAREVSPLPVAVGFGISRGEQVERLKGYAHGIVVGSALIKPFLEESISRAQDSLRNIVRELKSSLFLS